METQGIPTLPPKKEPTLNDLVLPLKQLQLIQIDQIYFSRRSGSEKCRQVIKGSFLDTTGQPRDGWAALGLRLVVAAREL